MENKNHVWKKWIYWFIFAVAVIFVYKTLDSFSQIWEWVAALLHILMPFIIGILIAYIFYLPCRKIETFYRKRKNKIVLKIARPLSVFTIYVIAIFLLILIFNFVIPSVTESIIELANNLPQYYQNITELLKQQPEDSIFNKIDAQNIIKELETINVKQFFSMESLTGYAKSAINLVSGLFSIFVSFVVSIYILVERAQILKFISKLGKVIFKEKTYEALSKYFSKTNEIFFRFLSSQLLDAIVVGILVSIAMLLLNVKYAVLLGFLIGVSNMIPYWGAIIGVGISIIITIFTGGVGQAITMGIIVIILQQIDANIINPKIVGNSLRMSPLLVIFAVTVGGAYFGILGMFLAVPVMAIIKVLITDYIEYKSKKNVPKGAD